MHLQQLLGWMCQISEGGQQSVGLPPQLVPKTQLEINVSMTLQVHHWDLTLFSQFWQYICTHASNKCVILEKGNKLGHCLSNWFPKLSFNLLLAWPYKQIAKSQTYSVQTVLTMHLPQQLGCTCCCLGGGQQSGALPPQLLHETQLQIAISMTLQVECQDLTCFGQFW